MTINDIINGYTSNEIGPKLTKPGIVGPVRSDKWQGPVLGIAIASIVIFIIYRTMK